MTTQQPGAAQLGAAQTGTAPVSARRSRGAAGALTADVVVVGGGNAAFSAAHAAAAAGARVVMLEKAGRDWAGGNTYFTAGAFRTVHDGLHDLLGLLDDTARQRADRTRLAAYRAEDYLGDLRRLTDGRADPVLADALVRDSRDCVEWLAARGIRWTLMYHRQAYEVDGYYRFWGGLALGVVDGGKGLWEQHMNAAQRAGVDVRFARQVTGLRCADTHISDIAQGEPAAGLAGGLVTGVDVLGPDGPERYDAPAVILAAGGFQANAALRAQHLGEAWTQARVRGTPCNTGDLLGPAAAVGAAVTGDWGGAHATAWDADAGELHGDRELTNRMTKQSYPLGIVVNRRGERFLDEGADLRNYTYARYGRRILEQPDGVAFQIFDATTRPLLRPEEYESPSVTTAQADTVAELGRRLGIDPQRFADTVAAYNAAVQPGPFDPSVKDGKHTSGVEPPKSNWALPLDSPPYVGYAVRCGITFTFGGLRTDAHGRVLSADGAPVAGLWAAGEIVGGLFHGNYPGGSGLMAGSVFGRRAGRAATARPSGTT